MALKLQNTVFPNLLTPTCPNHMEKSLIFHISDPVAFRLTITTFAGLFLVFMRFLMLNNVNGIQRYEINVKNPPLEF